MTNLPVTPSGTHPLRPEGTIIPARRDSVTALCVHTFLAIIAALALRLVFVHWFPVTTDDSAIYLQLANNWIDHHFYGLSQNGRLVPTDLRAPGYPAFLAGVTLLFRRSMRGILLSQAALDVFTSILTAALAVWLAPAGSRRRVWIIALWLAATCPFVANYSAVVLTEILVTFLATAALCCFVLGLRHEPTRLALGIGHHWESPFALALLGAFLTGAASLVRPEMPLLLGIAALVFGLRAWRALGARKAILFAGAMAGAFLLPLLPWAARNAMSLHELQFLAPRYATFPGEYAPVGYYAWTGTWVERYRDVFFSVWAIGQDRMDVNDLPASAFDSPEEKARVADLIAQYNDSPELDLSPEMDHQFAEIARERTRRHPLRTYVRVPFERTLTIWFTPRTELLPIDGKFWPLRDQWEDSHADVIVTGGFAVLGYLYVALAIGGIWLVWRTHAETWMASGSAPPNLWGIALLLTYFLVRTAFLTTVEAPEPRYVVSCYPAVLALVALLGIRNKKHQEAG
jgi:4-amino-4-deoxy-L-arabinose transferase-like glycosyltransferase